MLVVIMSQPAHCMLAAWPCVPPTVHETLSPQVLYTMIVVVIGRACCSDLPDAPGCQQGCAEMGAAGWRDERP